MFGQIFNQNTKNESLTALKDSNEGKRLGSFDYLYWIEHNVETLQRLPVVCGHGNEKVWWLQI